MKKFKLTGIAFLFLGCTTFAQTNETPRKAEATFTKMFPSATAIKWDKENSKEWEAEFTMKERNYSAKFTIDGTWLETEYDMNLNEIPNAVKKTLANDYSNYKVKESEFSETKDGALFEFELENGKEKLEVGISRDGKVAKKEINKDEEDND